ncbi:amino acid adenylation domain-containing protein [Actinokineospora sp. NPDC004072]
MLPDRSWTTGHPTTAPDGGLHEAVARTALFRPDAIALRWAGRATTYAELDRTADAWAARLAADGLGRGDIAAIALPRDADLVTALLAVLKTGAAYALIDPAWPARRTADALAVMSARLLIAPEGTAADCPVWTPTPDATPDGFRPVAVSAADPACVFFTSGTTGEPKCVLTPHGATARLFQANGFARFASDTAVPLAAPVPWDAFSLELWSVLLNGGTSVIVDEPYLSPAALRAGVADHGVDTTWLTSSLFNMVVDEDVAAFTGLRQVMVGGERLSTDHVRRFLRAHPGIALINGYGPVESVVFATTHRIREADCDHPDGIPLGRPVPGTQVHVLDGDRPCRVGETGEICVAGDGLAHGYLGDPALTAAKFTETPIDGRPTRVYRTGDLGVWGADGLLRFRGRADRQVKVRGHRVEPAEVERQVEAHPRVRRCRVVPRRDAAGAVVDLAAFCVPATEGDPLADLAAELADTLAAHHRPAVVHPVAAFPLTAQGKLDERALLALLPAAEPTEADGTDSDADPLTSAVVAAFRAVLGRSAVPADVSFFALGGTSLGAGRACARLAARLGRAVPVAELYRHPTAAGLAARLAAEAPAAARVADDDAVPLTPMQLVYLTRHLVDPTDRTNHCLLFWSVEGELNRAALRWAIEEVHLRHEALSAAYVADPRPGAWLIDVPPPELAELPAEPTEAAGIAALREALIGELDPTKGEIWRTAVVRAGEVTLFGCAVHHIAFDGWSESVLARDLAAAYNGTAETLPPAPTLAEAHRAHPAQNAQNTDVRAEFAGVPDLRWPDGALQGGGPLRFETTVDANVVAALDGIAAAEGQTRFVVLLALWAQTVAEVTGQRDFAVGVPVAQRDDPAIEHAVGCHISTVPLRLSGRAADGDVAETGRVAARAFARQDVPLTAVLAQLDRGRTARPPLFQVLFAVQDTATPRLDLDGVRTAFLRQPYVDLPLELHTEIWPSADGGLRVEVAYRPGAVPPAVAAELASRYAARLTTTPGARP